MRLPALSLKYKFIITLVCFTVLLTVTFGFIVNDRLSQELWKQFYSRGEDLVNTLASRINADPNMSTVKLLTENQTIKENLNFLGQYLFQGELVYSQFVYNGVDLTQNPGKVDVALLMKEPVSEPFLRRPFRLASGQLIWDFKRALRCGSGLEQTGQDVQLCNEPSYLRVGLSPVRVTRELRKAMALFVLVAAVFILVGVLVAFILYKWVLGPVEVLTSSVKQFRRDRFARAQVHSGDELETLADEFNKMVDTISEHEGHLEHVNQELHRANQVKSEFLAIMGHELKTPLHAISGFSQLLLQGVDGPLTDGQHQDIEAILGSGKHLLELIDNILRFSKLEAGEEPLHLETLYTNALVREALQSVESLVRHRGLSLSDQSQPLAVQADATKLKQILINLLSNAIKYTPSGSITVRTFVAHESVVFAVADTGPGIDAEDAKRVFDPFTQLDGSDTRASSGIGLGLAIVKKYVEMHRGRVWLEPNPGGGTVFSFSLPAVQPTLLTPERATPNGHRAAFLEEERR